MSFYSSVIYRSVFSIALTSLFLGAVHAQVIQPAYSSTASVNFIKTWTAQKPQTDSTVLAADVALNDVALTTQYLDGLDRPIQSVSRCVTPFGKDVVKSAFYDAYGREQYSYLPYTSTGSDGSLKLNPTGEQKTFYSSAASPLANQGETYYYGQTDFEASPLNRELKTFAPGNSWVGSRGTGTEHVTLQQYLLNTVSDSVRIWTISLTPGSLPTSSAAYPAGQLYKNVVVDEAGNQSVEYKDYMQRTILRKVQLASAPGTAHVGWLCTYYIYDDLNNLRFVLQPRAVELINANWTMTQPIADELCFRYEYDNRHRMIVKNIPGNGELWMVYDARDRLVMQQDIIMRAGTTWLVMTYDSQNRLVKTGRFTDANDRAYHQNLANNSITYPSIAVSSYEMLIQTFYDNYAWVAGEGSPVNAAFDANQTSTGFSSASNTIFPYPQNVAAMGIVTGMVTGTKTKVLRTTSTYMYTSTFYDDRGRVVQVSSTNVSGGKNIVTNQYSFDGKLLANKEVQNKAGANAKTYTIFTTNYYDAGSRLVSVNKNINGTSKTIVLNTYDELGRLMTKKLGTNPSTGNPLEIQSFDYNVRGWLLGVNRDFAKSTSTANNFGFDLGFDKTAVKTSGGTSLGTYTAAQYNGNIGGTVWRSIGDGEIRKYDFSYDNASRLLATNFNQYTSSTFNRTAGVDFSTSNLAYDANGNILTMKQMGLKVGGSSVIDQLQYTYTTNTNRLTQVTDAYNDNTSTLGDFKYDPASKGTTDYTYASNGVLVSDANKKISSIDYNYIMQPMVITVTGKGTISFSYDAAGNKLSKTVTDNRLSPARVTTTLYIGSSVYQNDTLQFISTEEGRARQKADGSFVYDYFLKDNLGNTRMVLTEEQKTDVYPPLNWEGTGSTDPVVTNQDNVWSGSNGQAVGIVANRMLTSSVPAPGFGSTGGTYVRQLKKSTGAFGGGALLRVMSGDQINTSVSYFYNTTSATNTTANGLNTLATSLLAAISGSSAVSATAKAGAITATNAINTAGSTADAFLSGEKANSTGGQPPEAYLHVLLFNEQFVFDNVNSYIQKVSVSGTATTITVSVNVKKNGYAYIYFSNESESPVWFDNFALNDVRGPLLEETHYYPFGLAMAGISSSAAGGMENRKKYNGIEYDSSLDIDDYEAHYRDLDPQTGRWWELDPKIENGQESLSPYTSMANDPIKLSDPLGDLPGDCCGTSVGILTGTQYAAGEANLALGGPLNPVADVVSAGIEVVGDLWAIGQAIHDYSKNSGAQIHPLTPLAPATTQTQVKTENLQDKEKDLNKQLAGQYKALQKHETKLQNYKDDPKGNDNKNKLSEEETHKEQKIAGRQEFLKKTIQNVQNQIKKVTEELKKIQQDMSKTQEQKTQQNGNK